MSGNKKQLVGAVIGCILGFGLASKASAFGLGDVQGAAGKAGEAKAAMDKAAPAINQFQDSAHKTLYQVVQAQEYMLYATATSEEKAKIKKQMDDLDKTTDPKEMGAKMETIRIESAAQLKKASDSGALQKQMSDKSGKVKEAVTNSTINTAVAVFRMKDLVTQGQALIAQGKQEPLAAAAYAPLAVTVPTIISTLKASSELLASNVKLLKGSNVAFVMPTSATKPADLSGAFK